MNNCLPSTRYDQIVEHALQFERKLDMEKGERKTVKRKSEEIDQLEEKEEEEECKRSKINKGDLEKQKKEIENTIKQVKDQMNGRWNKAQDTINNLVLKNTNEENNSRNQKPYFKPQTRSSINLCFHCAKPNHRFGECTNATEAKKDKIREALRMRKFDFKKLKDKANVISQQRKRKFSTESLNLNTPVQSA